MALWFPSGNTAASNLGEPDFDTTRTLQITAWIYTGPSQSAKLLSIWPGTSNGSFLVTRDTINVELWGHAVADFHEYFEGGCILKDAFAYIGVGYTSEVGEFPDNQWMFFRGQIVVTNREETWGRVRPDAVDEGPYGGGISAGFTIADLDGESLGDAGGYYSSGQLISSATPACDGYDLEAFDYWRVYDPVTQLSIGGVAAASLFEGAICEVALWDDTPVHASLLGMPRTFMPLLDTTNLLVYWPMINNLLPLYYDSAKNDYADLVGGTAGSAYFGAHPFPIEQSPWYGDMGQVVEKARPIFVDAVVYPQKPVPIHVPVRYHQTKPFPAQEVQWYQTVGPSSTCDLPLRVIKYGNWAGPDNALTFDENLAIPTSTPIWKCDFCSASGVRSEEGDDCQCNRGTITRYPNNFIELDSFGLGVSQIPKNSVPEGLTLRVVGRIYFEGTAPSELNLRVQAKGSQELYGEQFSVGEGDLYSVVTVANGDRFDYTFGGEGEGGGWEIPTATYLASEGDLPFRRCTMIDKGFGFRIDVDNPDGVDTVNGALGIDFTVACAYLRS